MSGAEAITIVQLLDACIGISQAIVKIAQAANDAQGLPERLRPLFAQFPTIKALFDRAKEQAKDPQHTQAAAHTDAEPVLRQCEEYLEQIKDLLERICPKTEPNRAQRIWEGIKTIILGRDSELQALWKQLQKSMEILEKKQILDIGDTLDDIKTAMGQLESEDEGRYFHSGAKNIIANEVGNPTNNVGGGEHNRYLQANTITTYNESNE